MPDVVFEVVSGTSGGSSEQTRDVEDEERVEDVTAFGEGSFPLAGPILEPSSRVLRGRCSSCSRRLRIRVEGEGPVHVRCPICGHARQLEL